MRAYDILPRPPCNILISTLPMLLMTSGTAVAIEKSKIFESGRLPEFHERIFLMYFTLVCVQLVMGSNCCPVSCATLELLRLEPRSHRLIPWPVPPYPMKLSAAIGMMTMAMDLERKKGVGA